MPVPDLSDAEIAAFGRAVVLAEQGAGTVLPNPVVGCVLLDPGGGPVGEGYHRRAGGPHAEVAALHAAGARARGATAVVTLEPCNHTGRTGPCTSALIGAGITRVVVGVGDPWPAASGGIQALRAAGIDVVDLPALVPHHRRSADLVAAAEEVNRVWLTAVRTGRPFVTFKTGTTIDGRVAAPDGTSRWITSPQSRADVHRLRGRVDTIVVGIGTVLDDDPALTVRDAGGQRTGRQPLRVVLDTEGRTPAGARVRNGDAETMIATAAEFGHDPAGRVDMEAVLRRLYDRGRRHVLLEGGPRLAAAAMDAGLVDEVLVYVAPLVLGAGRSSLEGGAARTLTDARRLQLRQIDRLDGDVRLRYRVLPR